MKKILFIIPPEKFRDEEILVPMEILKSAGIQFEVGGMEINTSKGMKGAEMPVTRIIKDIRPEEYDAFIVIGGQGTLIHLWNNLTLIKLFKEVASKGKIVAGICAGAVVLAHAGLLENKKATTFNAESYIHELKRSGAIYTGKKTEIAGKIITASGPDAVEEFGKAILEVMKIHTHDSISMHITTPFDDV